MIDNFSLGLSHGLMLLAAWLLLSRPDLDDDAVRPEAGGHKSGLWDSLRSRFRA
jgi:hypothetical protein